jgi:integrase
MAASQESAALVPAGRRLRLDSRQNARSVRSAHKRWQPPEGLSPQDVQAVIDAATRERDRLLLRVLWATGARVSEVLALRPMDVQRDHLVLPNRKNEPARQTRVSAGGPGGFPRRSPHLGQ